MAQWNAERLSNKKPELQETPLKNTQRFFIKCHEVFRQDREVRHNVKIIISRNIISIPAVELCRSEKEELEHRAVKLLLGDLLITNCYSPPAPVLALSNATVRQKTETQKSWNAKTKNLNMDKNTSSL